MKKRNLAVICAVCMICSGAFLPETALPSPVLTACAEDTAGKIGVLTYEKLDSGIRITACDPEAETVEIPEEIEGMPVNIIGEDAFSETAVRSVTIPDSVTVIEFRAFGECPNLSEVKLSSTLDMIDASAFEDCTKLEEITLPESLNYIGSCAFKNTGLKNINIPEAVYTFGFEAFDGTPYWEELTTKNPLVIFNHIVVDGRKCTGDVVIPNGVKIISNYAFESASEVTSIQIPDSVFQIGTDAFSACTGLTSITIPDSVKEIPIGAFSDSGLTSFTIPDSIENIRSNAFAGCTALEEVNFPDHQIDIYSEAFAGTPWLEAKQAENPLVIVNHTLIDGKTCKGDVVIPEDVTIIAAKAFEYNEDITSVVIPASVHDIWDGTFNGCVNLKSAELPEVSYIGMDAFCECKSLENLKLSRRLTMIFDGAFYKCTKRANIVYTGTKEDWNQIEIGEDNTLLMIANYSYSIRGDIDQNGSLGVADVIALQKWLLAVPDAKCNSDLADLDGNEIINIYDFCLLKKELLKK